MAYRFTLAPVLRVRENIEKRDLHLLEQTQHEIAHIIRLLESARDRERAELATRERELATGTRGTYLHIVEGVKKRTREAQRALEQKLAELQVRREQQLANYNSSKRKREVLSDLRDRQEEAYEFLASRGRQQVADDLFLARRRRK